MDDARVTAWHPDVPGVAEVLHARFTDHAYPMHSHDSWTLLVVDSGTVRYELGRVRHATTTTSVTLLPPDVSHDGRGATEAGFRKRVVYLDRDVIGAGLLGSAVDRPAIIDGALHARVARLHDALATRRDDFEAEGRLAFVTERLRQHLRGSGSAPEGVRGAGVAVALRELLDSRLVEGLSLGAAAGILHSHPTHLVRAFSAEFGVPPHLYVTGRRVELARRHLLDGMPAAEAATRAGFYDQSHLSRHFKRMHGVTPVAFASGRAA
jgi:AraC-like DNA-binding protein